MVEQNGRANDKVVSQNHFGSMQWLEDKRYLFQTDRFK